MISPFLGDATRRRPLRFRDINIPVRRKIIESTRAIVEGAVTTVFVFFTKLFDDFSVFDDRFSRYQFNQFFCGHR
jgi:hypothetical protein